MSIIRDLTKNKKISEFKSDFPGLCATKQLRILGSIGLGKPHYYDLTCSIGYHEHVYTVWFDYNTYHKTWKASIFGNGFKYIYPNEPLGDQLSDVASKLSSCLANLEEGILPVYYRDTFSLVEHAPTGDHTVGIGLRYKNVTYYLFNSDIDRLGLPKDLLTETVCSIDCFRIGDAFSTIEVFEKKVNPIITRDDFHFALKVLLTVCERNREFYSEP